MNDTTLMLAADGTIWFVQHTEDFRLQARRYRDGRPGPIEFDVPTGGGADAVLDSEGRPWVVWCPDNYHVYAAKYEDGAWSPHHQITTFGENYDPCIAPDEYGNVWIFWCRVGAPSDIWMCRMGPRSGQETLVVCDADGGPASVLACQGRLLVTFIRNEPEGYWIVEGTEHEGFGEPVRVATD